MSTAGHSSTSAEEEPIELELRKCPPRYSDSFRQQIASLIRQGFNPQEIASDLCISPRTVQRYRRNMRAFGVHDPKPCGLRGRPQKLTVALQEAMLEYLNEQTEKGPCLEKVKRFLWEEYAVVVSGSAISRCLKRLGWVAGHGTAILL